MCHSDTHTGELRTLLVSSEDISRGQLVVLAVQKIPKKMRRGPGNCTPYHTCLHWDLNLFLSHVQLRASCGWPSTPRAKETAVSAGSVQTGWWVSTPWAGQHKSACYRLRTPWGVCFL